MGILKIGDSARETILSAIYTLSEAMKCFDFVVVDKGAKVSRKKDHLFISKADAGCYSTLGRKGGMQITGMAEGCNLYGTTIHEIMHVLGFYHEHVRQDRDQFVEVDWSKLTTETRRHQFKIREDQIMLADTYDFDSLMHYPIQPALKPRPVFFILFLADSILEGIS